MKRSKIITKGIWQYEFRENEIEVVEWSEVPKSTKQWIVLNIPALPWIKPKYNNFYLLGTSHDDVRIVPVEDLP